MRGHRGEVMQIVQKGGSAGLRWDRSKCSDMWVITIWFTYYTEVTLKPISARGRCGETNQQGEYNGSVVLCVATRLYSSNSKICIEKDAWEAVGGGNDGSKFYFVEVIEVREVREGNKKSFEQE